MTLGLNEMKSSACRYGKPSNTSYVSHTLCVYHSPSVRCAGVGPAIIASFALALSCVANFACETIKFTNQGEIPDVADGTLHFGPWYQQSTQVSQVNGTYDYFVKLRRRGYIILYESYILSLFISNLTIRVSLLLPPVRCLRKMPILCVMFVSHTPSIPNQMRNGKQSEPFPLLRPLLVDLVSISEGANGLFINEGCDCLLFHLLLKDLLLLVLEP